jgi:hypothetical protein
MSSKSNQHSVSGGPWVFVFLNRKDVIEPLQELFPMKKKHIIASNNSLTIVNRVLAEAKKHYNKELEQKIEFIFHTDDSTSYKGVKRLASACKKSKKTCAYLKSCNFTFTNTTATAVRTAAEEYCFAVCGDIDYLPCNMNFNLTPFKDVLATISSKKAVYVKSDALPLPGLLSKEMAEWATANSIPTISWLATLPSSSLANYKKVIVDGSDLRLDEILQWLSTANFDDQVLVVGALNGQRGFFPFEMYQVKSGSKNNAASNEYSELSNYNYDKNLAATLLQLNWGLTIPG